MRLLEKILVATDFSHVADDAVRAAISLAKTFGSELVLLHVLREVPGSPIALDMLKDKVTERLQGVRRDIEAEKVQVAEAAVASGVPFDQIIQYADRHDVNVIIVGSGEKTGDDRFQLGITAERLLRKANKPVWVVKAGTAPGIKRMLCPVDCSDPSRRALRNAVHLARNCNAELTVLNVIQPWGSFNPAYTSLDDVAAEAQSAYMEEQQSRLDRFLQDFDFHGVSWKNEVRQGAPHREILTVTGEMQPDLIVMGTVGKTGLTRILMGSVTEKVVREMPCSVITVKSEHAIRLRLEAQAADIETHFKQGMELLDKGFPAEALREFEYCLAKNPTYAFAWEQIATVHERMGDKEEAETCQARAKQIFQTLWEQRVQADIRSQHPLFGKGREGK